MIQEAGAKALERSDIVRDFAHSELFDRTFREGMELVEAAAAYLDGPGRQQSKLLSRNAALAYAAESMRLTTRLMQVASWLLVQRAVREGDMTVQEACESRYRMGPKPAPKSPVLAEVQARALEDLPEGLRDLGDRSERIYDRIAHLDQRVYVAAELEAAPNPVLSQFERLRAAFQGE